MSKYVKAEEYEKYGMYIKEPEDEVVYVSIYEEAAEAFEKIADIFHKMARDVRM